jgi:hypothetical protein
LSKNIASIGGTVMRNMSVISNIKHGGFYYDIGDYFVFNSDIRLGPLLTLKLISISNKNHFKLQISLDLDTLKKL